MSLFNVCNWWASQCCDLDDNYDVASLLCARFGLEEHEKDYVVVGSHAGHLSIFYPSLDMERNENNNSYKPTDLLLEKLLNAPILGIYAGKFSGNIRNENSNHLAVLHPYSVAIYNIHTVNGVAEHGTQLSLQPLAEYKFRRIAFDFCKGHFGKVKGREFFCIVHLDGALTFYEQDGISYECQFPGHRSLPAPLVYCERTDSFFRFGAAWNLECFTYQDLSHSSINKAQYQPVWSVCLGEGIVDMRVVQVKEESASIMVLGERNFISLSDNGKVNFILKLDYAPKCFHSFVVGYYWEPTSRLITAIVSENSKLFIYEDANIIWAAQYQDEVPVAIKRSNVSGLPGGIITLGATGQIRVGYLGSDPFLFKVPSLNVKELTFSQAHKELMELEEEIKEAVDISDMESINRRATDDVRVYFCIDSDITEESDTLLLDVSADVALKELPSCAGSLKFKSKVELAELQITFNMPEGIRCSQDTLTYVGVKIGMTQNLNLNFYVAELLHVHSTIVNAVISYISSKGIPRVIQHASYLPLGMFFKVTQPQKAAAIKLTFNPKSTPKMSLYFPEFVTWESEVQALGLELIYAAEGKMEEVITIVTAKNSNRLRIQSDSLETFPMILERLVKISVDSGSSNNESKSGKEHKQKGRINPLTQSIMATALLPTYHILHRIDVHHETQENIRKQTLEMDELWQQFKTLQRKLQEKPEDEPRDALVMQIEENYDHLITEGDKLMDMRKNEKRQRCDLTCAIAVTNWIISLLHIEEKVVNVITSVLCTPVEDWSELSWEESMSPGIAMLHHYGPLNRAKNPASKNMTDANTSFENFDYNRFRRHFVTLFERITRLASTSSDEPELKDTKASVEYNAPVVSGLNQVLEAAGGNDEKPYAPKNALSKQHSVKRSTLEAVEDNEEEYDEEDLRKVGYKKDYGTNTTDKSNECSEWIGENFELPSSEELFSDLGIWW